MSAKTPATPNIETHVDDFDPNPITNKATRAMSAKTQAGLDLNLIIAEAVKALEALNV